MAAVTVRYWAGARRAAGFEHEELVARTLGDVRAALLARPNLRAVAEVSSFLVDGQRVGDEALLTDGVQIDVMPPFAGG